MEDKSTYYLARSSSSYPMVCILNFTPVKFGEADRLEVVTDKAAPTGAAMPDFLRSAKDIFTTRITDVMKAMNMEGIRFFPATVDTKRGIAENYECVFAEDNTYELLDKEQSVFQYRHSIYRISELVIDRAKLSEIPLGKRLCMRLKEAPGHTLYHQSVVDAVMALEPRGMYFTNVEEITT